MIQINSRYVALAVLTFAQAGAALITSGLGALAPFLAGTLAINSAQIGMLNGVIGITWIFVSAIAGVLVDRYSERNVIVLSGLGMAAALFAAATIGSFIWLLIWFGVFGMLATFSNPAGGRAIMLWFKQDRGFAMGMRQAGVPIGGFLAAVMLAPIASHYGYRTGLIAAGLFIIATSVSVFLMRPPATPERHTRARVHLLWKQMRSFARDPRSMLLSLAQADHNAAQTCAYSFLSISLLATTPMPITAAVLPLATMQIGSIVGRFLWGTISDRVLGGDRLVPVAAASVIGAAAELFFAFHHTVISPGIALGIYASAFLLGCSIAGCNGLFAVAQVEVAGPQLAGSALGIASSRTAIAMAFAPPAFGLIADHWGYSSAWITLAIVTLLGIVPALYARRLIAIYSPETV